MGAKPSKPDAADTVDEKNGVAAESNPVDTSAAEEQIPKQGGPTDTTDTTDTNTNNTTDTNVDEGTSVNAVGKVDMPQAVASATPESNPVPATSSVAKEQLPKEDGATSIPDVRDEENKAETSESGSASEDGRKPAPENAGADHYTVQTTTTYNPKTSKFTERLTVTCPERSVYDVYASFAPPGKLDQQIDEEHNHVNKHLNKIAMHIEDWDTQLAPAMNIAGKDISDIKTKFSGQPSRQRIEFLTLWKTRCGIEATYRSLMHICLDNMNRHCASIIAKLWTGHGDYKRGDSGSLQVKDQRHYESLKLGMGVDFTTDDQAFNKNVIRRIFADCSNIMEYRCPSVVTGETAVIYKVEFRNISLDANDSDLEEHLCKYIVIQCRDVADKFASKALDIGVSDVIMQVVDYLENFPEKVDCIVDCAYNYIRDIKTTHYVDAISFGSDDSIVEYDKIQIHNLCLQKSVKEVLRKAIEFYIRGPYIVKCICGPNSEKYLQVCTQHYLEAVEKKEKASPFYIDEFEDEEECFTIALEDKNNNFMYVHSPVSNQKESVKIGCILQPGKFILHAQTNDEIIVEVRDWKASGSSCRIKVNEPHGKFLCLREKAVGTVVQYCDRPKSNKAAIGLFKLQRIDSVQEYSKRMNNLHTCTNVQHMFDGQTLPRWRILAYSLMQYKYHNVVILSLVVCVIALFVMFIFK